MSFLGLLNQKLTLYTKTGYDDYGREAVGSGTTVNCRFQKTTIRRLLDNGSLILIEAECWVPPDTTISVDDKVVFGSESYKVFNKYEAITGNGGTHHIKVELIKWQT
ncbi:MAG: hypothetical protein WC871_02340 [Bacteroidales bacterium]|jgi:hypothetical protein